MLRTASTPDRLMLGSACSYALVFATLVAVGRPGLGVGQGFYVSIVLAALATDAATGAVAGVWALVLYLAAELIAGRENLHDVVSDADAIRLAAYVSAGVIVGWFATRARGMLAESLHVLDDLLAVARRDAPTGAHTRDALEDALRARLERRAPFALLVAQTPPGSDPARLLAAAAAETDELARIAPDRVAALVDADTSAAAEAAAGRVEGRFAGAIVGWALHPEEGDGSLALFAAAGERLQRRRTAPAA